MKGDGVTEQELIESLYLQPKHICGDYAEWYLEPPRKGCGWTQLNIGRMKAEPEPRWMLTVDGNSVPIRYCP